MRLEAGPIIHELDAERTPHLDRHYDLKLVDAILAVIERAGIDWHHVSVIDLRLDERHAGHADMVVEHFIGARTTVTILDLDLDALRRAQP